MTQHYAQQDVFLTLGYPLPRSGSRGEGHHRSLREHLDRLDALGTLAQRRPDTVPELLFRGVRSRGDRQITTDRRLGGDSPVGSEVEHLPSDSWIRRAQQSYVIDSFAEHEDAVQPKSHGEA